jgi:hypothetical protein
MPITPNVSQEQANKQALRAQTRAGVTPANPNPPVDEAILVNAFSQASGILRLTGVLSGSTFTISGPGGNSATITGSTAKVSDLVTALGNGPLSSTSFVVNAGPAQLLKGNTGAANGGAVVDIIVPSGSVLTVISVSGTAPSLSAVTLTGSLATSYPSYVGTPNATPNWTDDVTVHYYPVGFGGMISNSTILTGGTTITTTGTLTQQQQVRQISTQVSETQEYDGYFATYSGNLYQTAQKRTWRQQS